MTPYELLKQAVEDLAKDLPGTTFGYIGNIERWGDDRLWMIFLPHPGRVGAYTDSVRIGGTDELAAALEDWPRLAGRARNLYFNGTVRVNGAPPAHRTVCYPCCNAWGDWKPNHVCDPPRRDPDNS